MAICVMRKVVLYANALNVHRFISVINIAYMVSRVTIMVVQYVNVEVYLSFFFLHFHIITKIKILFIYLICNATALNIKNF